MSPRRADTEYAKPTACQGVWSATFTQEPAKPRSKLGRPTLIRQPRPTGSCTHQRSAIGRPPVRNPVNGCGEDRVRPPALRKVRPFAPHRPPGPAIRRPFGFGLPRPPGPVGAVAGSRRLFVERVLPARHLLED